MGMIWILNMEIHVHVPWRRSFFLGLMIFLITTLDSPFRGEASVGPVAINNDYDLMKPNAPAPMGGHSKERWIDPSRRGPFGATQDKDEALWRLSAKGETACLQ